MRGYGFIFDDAEFITVDAVASGMQDCVVPVMFEKAGKPAKIEGTAFCIAELINGEAVFVTAKHVVEQLDGSAGISPYLCLPRVRQDGDGVNDRHLMGVYIHQICVANTHSDVALLVVDKTKSPIPLRPLSSLRLTMDAPQVGTRCMGLGYPQSADGRSGDLMASRGTVREIHPNKRDSSLSVFPSFRTDAAYPSGMSGGPILDSNGMVAGVISHDTVSDDGPLGYGAAVAAIAELKVDLHADNGELTEFTFPDLVQMQAISNISQSAMTLVRDDNGVLLTWASD